MSNWDAEKRARFLFFVGLSLLALISIIPYDFWREQSYDVMWIYQDGWIHGLAVLLILFGAWKWIDARSS